MATAGWQTLVDALADPESPGDRLIDHLRDDESDPIEELIDTGSVTITVGPRTFVLTVDATEITAGVAYMREEPSISESYLAKGGQDTCGITNQGFSCTCVMGHKGPHVSHIDDKPYHVWEA